jgi:dCMP deaminase
MKRLDWTSYFMALANLTAQRSPCLSQHVGAILTTTSHRVLSIGYNGPPSGIQHCQDECKRRKLGYTSGKGLMYCKSCHAEENAILSCAITGTKIENAILYCTHFPCSHCMKMILSLDIKQIIYKESYPDELSVELLKEKKFIYKEIENNFYSWVS